MKKKEKIHNERLNFFIEYQNQKFVRGTTRISNKVFNRKNNKNNPESTNNFKYHDAWFNRILNIFNNNDDDKISQVGKGFNKSKKILLSFFSHYFEKLDNNVNFMIEVHNNLVEEQESYYLDSIFIITKFYYDVDDDDEEIDLTIITNQEKNIIHNVLNLISTLLQQIDEENSKTKSDITLLQQIDKENSKIKSDIILPQINYNKNNNIKKIKIEYHPIKS